MPSETKDYTEVVLKGSALMRFSQEKKFHLQYKPFAFAEAAGIPVGEVDRLHSCAPIIVLQSIAEKVAATLGVALQDIQDTAYTTPEQINELREKNRRISRISAAATSGRYGPVHDSFESGGTAG